MDRLLIAEDEKLIRQGLRAIVGRADVPIGEILECRNGEEALQILKSTPVDVLFTDVRMPKMDGLTLLRKIQEDQDPSWKRPEIVMISGHDDFNYAVEAMRYGSREYILKPVKRERVYESLHKLEQLISQRNNNTQKQEQLEKLSRRHLKYLLANPGISGDELDTIKTALGDVFHCDEYMVFSLNRDVELSRDESAVKMEIGVFQVIAVPKCGYRDFIQRNLSGYYIGASSVHKDLSDFREAFEQSVSARKCAFFTGKRVADFDMVAFEGGGVLPRHSAGQLTRQLGSKQYAELVHILNSLFTNAARGLLLPYIFEEFLLDFLNAVADIFARYLEKEERIADFKSIYRYDTVDTYRMAFFDWLDRLNCQIFAELESSHNFERIQEAVEYINENYSKSLNMAVVSNHISMNYSVFSQLFRERIGKSFVDYLRDLRIAKAESLLVDTSMKISEISDEIGFESDKYFMKSFKAVLGVSPTQYRKTEQIKKYGEIL